MTVSKWPRALIVGAGIGGLASALALEQAGLSTLVLERAAQPRELGFSLLLASNAMCALRMLGVADRLIARAEVGSVGELRVPGGRVLRRVTMDALKRETGEAVVCAQRQALHGTLLDALRTTELRTSAHVVGFQQTAKGVEVELAGGERLQGELLIAADGIHSVVRKQLHDDPLRASGLMAFRGACRGSWPVTGSQYFGRGLEAGVARSGADNIYWFVSRKLEPRWMEQDVRSALLECVRDFEPAFMELVDRTESGELRRDALFDREPLARWGEGRVTLLGDAAHPMLPHAGQGAAQTLEDAVVLGRCLGQSADVEPGLRRYEQLRQPRTSMIVRLSRRNARISSTTVRPLCALRDWILEHGPATLLERQLVALARVDLAV